MEESRNRSAIARGDIVSLERISDYLDFHAERTPTAPAASLNGRAVSYAELKSKVDDCARALIASGVEKGDRVATLSTPHPDFLVAFLATVSIGGVWLGLNPRYTLREFSYVMEDAKPAVLLTRTQIGARDYCDDVKALVENADSLKVVVILSGDPAPDCPCASYDAFISGGVRISDEMLEKRRRQTKAEDAALIVYTSGSTGAPKGALLPHRGLVTCCRVQARYWNANPVRILNYLPINHVGCVGDISSFILVAGGCNIFMEQFDAARCMELIEEESITIWGGVPTTIQMCLDLPDVERYDLSSVQLIVWSGASAPEPLIERMRKITPNLSTSYGLTESVGSVTYAPVGAAPEVLSKTIGAPAPDYEFRIAAPDGAAAPVGQEGEIQLRGDFLMLGYFNRPEATKETIDDNGWLRTGDLGRLRADGNVELVGRVKEMYKSGGYNVYPREIEAVLESHPGVALAAVIGVSDPLYGETGRAFLTPESGINLDTDEVAAFCRQRLANYKVPKSFTVELSMPLLPIGKIDKPALKARFAPVGEEG